MHPTSLAHKAEPTSNQSWVFTQYPGSGQRAPGSGSEGGRKQVATVMDIVTVGPPQLAVGSRMFRAVGRVSRAGLTVSVIGVVLVQSMTCTLRRKSLTGEAAVAGRGGVGGVVVEGVCVCVGWVGGVELEIKERTGFWGWWWWWW